MYIDKKLTRQEIYDFIDNNLNLKTANKTIEISKNKVIVNIQRKATNTLIKISDYFCKAYGKIKYTDLELQHMWTSFLRSKFDSYELDYENHAKAEAKKIVSDAKKHIKYINKCIADLENIKKDFSI